MTSEPVAVRLRIDQSPGISPIDLGVPLRIRPVSVTETGLRSSDRARATITAVAPISHSADRATLIHLLPGDYDVSGLLPSGEYISEEFHVSAVAGTDNLVILSALRQRVGREGYWSYPATPMIPSIGRSVWSKSIFSPARSIKVTLGSRVSAQGTRVAFDASSWSSWFSYFSDRFFVSNQSLYDLALTSNPSRFEARSEESFDGNSIRVMLIETNPQYFEPERVGKEPIFAALEGRRQTRICLLPLPWGTHYHDRGVFELIATEGYDTLHCQPHLLDERWSGLIAYLNVGRADLAAEIFDQARDALFGKFENPLAAAAGGYALLSAGGGNQDKWPGWLGNLAHRFPYFADGAILRAKWLLARGKAEDFGKARDLLINAFNRGLPYYTTGVLWLIEGLERMAPDSEACRTMLEKVRGVARWIDFSQVFTSFSIDNSDRRSFLETKSTLDNLPGIALGEPETGRISQSTELSFPLRVDVPQRLYLTED